jgi:hypothetical protein
LTLAAALALPLTAPKASLEASPLVSIGDSTDVFFSGSSSLRSTSNVFRDEDNEVSDLIWILSPGFEVNVGRGLSNANLSLITRYDIVRYEDESRLDTELFHIKAIGSYKTSRLDLSGSVSFDENKTSTGNESLVRVQDLIEFDTTKANFNGEYRFSPKFSFGAGVRYSEKEYKTFQENFADRETTSFPFDIFYELTPKVDLSVGYTYSNTDVDAVDARQDVIVVGGVLTLRKSQLGGYEQDSHFFNIGARGNLLPKLNGFFKIGYRARSTEDSTFTFTDTPLNGAPPSSGTRTINRDDTGMLGLDADLTWTATPKVTAILGLSRDFGVGGEGQSTENTGIDLRARYAINSQFSASANFGYTLRDFTNDDREDDRYNIGARLGYSLNQYWQFSTGYTYTENSSDAPSRSYEDHTIDLSVSLRY